MRTFSDKQRRALFILADGKCQQCGCALSNDWHADHVTPYTLGGTTDVINGQALCQKCNLRKGVSVSKPIWPGGDRKWQTDAFAAWQESRRDDFLAVAWPGAGKTRFALRVIRVMIDIGSEFTIVVVPTIALKKQWAEDASLFGIKLDYLYDNNRVGVSSDFDGIVVTYGTVNSQPDLYRKMSKGQLVVFDEIHHAGEEKTWGASLRVAFEYARRRLLLSGTPFRTDGQPIPYVNYDDAGKCVPDYVYGYPDALQDNVCRHLYFPTLEGKMTWQSGVDEITATFEDELSGQERSRRLRTALMPDGDFLQDALSEADKKLTEVRNDGHVNAGGLVICMDKTHAEQIARIIKKSTGIAPVLVLHDVEDAHDKIARFEKGEDRWIVAVKMVSEGIDIKRLRVLLYATNTTTEMFFDQAIGRVIRVITGMEYQPAFCYLPRDPKLLTYAKDIMEQRDHFLREVEDRERKEMLDEPSQPTLFAPLYAGNMERRETIGTLGSFTAEEIAHAEAQKARHGWPFPAEAIAEIMRCAPGYARQDNGSVAPAPDGKRPVIVTESDKRKQLKNKCNAAVNALHHQSGGILEHPYINRICNWYADVNSIDQINTHGLQDRWDFLVEWRRAYEAGSGPGFDGKRVFCAIAERNAEQRRNRVEARP